MGDLYLEKTSGHGSIELFPPLFRFSSHLIMVVYLLPVVLSRWSDRGRDVLPVCSATRDRETT